MDPGITHRVPLHPDQKGRGGVADQLLIEIDTPLQMIIGGRGKPRLHRGRNQRKTQTRALLEGYRGLDFHAQEYGLGFCRLENFKLIYSRRNEAKGWPSCSHRRWTRRASLAGASEYKRRGFNLENRKAGKNKGMGHLVSGRGGSIRSSLGCQSVKCPTSLCPSPLKPESLPSPGCLPDSLRLRKRRVGNAA